MRLCSTATRRASIASLASNSPTVRGPGISTRSPLSWIVKGIYGCGEANPMPILAHIYTEDRVSDKDQGMGLDRGAVVSWYERNRARSRALFDLLAEDAYYSQPIDLRHPIVFYEGHLPAFSFLTLVRKGLGCPSIDLRLETLFARGIDPAESEAPETMKPHDRRLEWPSRDLVRQFAQEADRRVLEALEHGGVDLPRAPRVR